MKLDPLDVLFSKFIRMRAMSRVGGCERCLHTKVDYKQLQCSHFHGRGKKSVRWDEDNSVGLCGGCHMYLTAHPTEHVRWFEERLGGRADLLEARMRATRLKPDKVALKFYYLEQIKGLE